MKQALLVMNDGPGLAAEVDVHIETSHDVRMDVMSLVLGNPVATISVFTLAGAFLSSMAGKAAEDAYQILKRALSRATPVVRDGSAQDTTWAVIHDVENNCVIECPKEIPAEAAAQLAQLAREGLSQRHIRWDPENRRWQAVGSISGEPPQPPPDENPPSEPPRPPDE
ncbi:hypothetical protein [Streptomyces sp. V1I1]|uniref:hypothetical protein n=1 Tax=Streptomyces sp. V1I1 TaxID=3042272 RepID=UPI0027D7BDAD|nr:hypothetical protein [Streptomyces sp. V1I1]